MSLNLPSTVAEYIEHFTGRAWLLPRLLDWLGNSNERFLVLTGGPGTGKSMIMAWLAGFGPSPDDATACEQLAQLRAQVKAAHFCIADSGTTAPKVLAQTMADQLTRNISGFADALAASLAELVTITTIQKVDKMERGASVSGVQIGTLNLGGLSEELSFNRTLRDPIKILYETGHDEPMLFLVDALDEAATYTGAIDIVRLLVKLGDLPAQVRILVTTRPDPKVLKHFRRVRSIDLIDDAPQEIDDVQEYVLGRLYQLDDEPRKRLAQRLAGAAEGNFLYAHLVLEDLLPRLPDVGDLDTLPFPEKLQGLYHSFLLRVLDSDDPQWYSLFGPVLGLIAVAQSEGLSKAQLDWLVGQDTVFPLRVCKQFLQGDLLPGPFRCFHRSFVEYLLEDKENVDYHLDTIAMHGRIANRYWESFGQDKQKGWGQCDPYGLRHLPLHQRRSRQVEKLRQLLLDFGWLKAKLCAASIAALNDDYDLLSDDPDARLVQGAVQRALRQAAHILDQDPGQLAGQLWGRLRDEPVQEIKALLGQAARSQDGPWLQPLSASLDQPEAVVRRLVGHRDRVKGVAVTPDGRRAISASKDTWLRVWDLEQEDDVRILIGHEEQVNCVAVTPDSRRAISGSRDKTLRVWDLRSGQELRPPLEGHTGEVLGMAVTPDGKYAISASADRTLIKWDLNSGKRVHTLKGHTGWVCSVAVTPDGRRAISGSRDKTFRVWDLETGREVCTLLGHCRRVSGIAVRPEHDQAISASHDRTLVLWDLQRMQVPRTLTRHLRGVRSVTVTPDEKYAISASGDHTLIKWDLETRKALFPLKGHTDRVNCVAVTPDGRRAISGSRDKTLRVWDLRSGQELRPPLEGHTDEVLSVAVVPSAGQYAISASSDGTLIKWDLNSGEAGRPLGRHTKKVYTVAVTPDGRYVISGSSGSKANTIKVWDLETGSEVPGRKHYTSGVRSIVVIPDENMPGEWRFISASSDWTLRLWDLKGDSEGSPLGDHTDWVKCVAVSGNGKWAVSASKDKTLKVWDLESKECIASFNTDEELHTCAIAPDRMTIVAGGACGRVHFCGLANSRSEANGHPKPR